MEVFKLIDKAKNGYLRVAVPKNFEDKKLEIEVKIVEDEGLKEVPVDAIEKRGKALSARFGKAKFKDYLIREDDVYYQ